MCEYLSFCSTWTEGEGVQVFSAASLKGHAETVQLWDLPDDARRWSWERDGENSLVLSHGQEMTPERDSERAEILRLWPDRGALTMYLIGKLHSHDKLSGGSLDLNGCTGLTALPDGLSVGGYLYLGGCTGLTALPDGLSVGGSLYLGGQKIVVPKSFKGNVVR